MTTAEPVDVLIIGGGPAGLTTALTVARQLHTAVVFDSASYRNGASIHMHTVLTWDHKDPKEFRAAARQNILDGYQTIQFAEVELESVRKIDEGLFEAIDVGGSQRWIGRKVVLATGTTDIYPQIHGYADCWAKGIFHCLFCHGYEERHAASSGVLAVGDLANAKPATHFARNALQLTPKKCTLYTNGAEELAATIVTELNGASNFHVDTREIQRLEKGAKGAEVIIHFKDGSTTTEGFLGHKPKTALKGEFAKALGLELTPQGDIKVLPPFNQTSVRGVFAAGDASTLIKIVTSSLFTGAAVGAGVAAQLQAEKHGQQGMV